MANYTVNQAAVGKARSMIESSQYVLESDWAEAQPDTDAENDELERHGWDGYAEWHLALDSGAGEQTKDRYGFPYGDFRRVHRSGLIHAKQRAAQYGHDDVERAADDLLEKLDEAAAD